MSKNRIEIDLDQVEDYLFCSLQHYWKHVQPVPGSPIKNVTLDLPQVALSSALALWASDKYAGQTFLELTRNVWVAWFEHYQIKPQAIDMMNIFAEGRNELLFKFLEGSIRKRDGSKYIEPRMTKKYRSMLATRGFDSLPARVEPFVLAQFGTASAELAGLGLYTVTDAYADSLLMASRYTPPVAQAIAGVDVPVVISVQGVRVTAKADLIIQGEDGFRVEVHDFMPKFFFSRKWISKSVKFIAAAMFSSSDIGLQQAQSVVYRHFMSAQTHERKSARTSRLGHAIVAAARGIDSGFILPAFFSGLDRCVQCSFADHCLGEEEDVIEHYYPGLLKLGGSSDDHQPLAVPASHEAGTLQQKPVGIPHLEEENRRNQ